jgi:hypothetical protein
MAGGACRFTDLLAAELRAVADRRRAFDVHSEGASQCPGEDPANDPEDLDKALARVWRLRRWANQSGILGLAISGGGIRSATFALGIIQALAEEKILRCVDYLSTVSGGGYIGSWLLGLFQRRLPAVGIDKLERDLTPPVSPTRVEEYARQEDPSIHWLRDYSNYLAPRPSLFSADVWSIGAIWLRNTLLNQIIAVCMLGAALLIPRVMLLGLPPEVDTPGGGGTPALIASVLFLIAAKSESRTMTQGHAIQVALLLFASSYAVTVVLCMDLEGRREYFRALAQTVLAAGSLSATIASVTKKSTWAGLRALMATVVATSVFMGVIRLAHNWVRDFSPEKALVLGPSVVLLLFASQVVVVLGMMGRSIVDEVREWWSRIGAWLAIVAMGMGALAAIALYGPYLVEKLSKDAKTGIPAAGAWIAANAWGLLSGWSPKTNGTPKSGWHVADAAARLAPPVFAIGLLLLVATLVNFLVPVVGSIWALGGVLLAIGVILSFTVDINEFSMMNFYKNRLVRCYLGASNPDRQKFADALTNFTKTDDVSLKYLRTDCRYHGPVPIINVAMNVAEPEAGKQERKAQNFVLGPYYCGFGETQDPAQTTHDRDDWYRPTAPAQTGGDYYLQAADGVYLGQAMTISGAAASPNMGYHTSTPVALLMTIFNVRLGHWLPNPACGHWTGYGPHFGGGPLAQELFAKADKKSSFIYVSDGGHFENMGVYELLRRRARYIILCDGEQDGSFCFGGVGGLIRKARGDFGIEIRLDTSAISKRDAQGHSQVHCAVGSILYPEPGLTGTLLYMKTSVTGDEPGDVLQYQSANKEFPHQTTGDQFFSESQFEAYRRLGYHVMMTVLRPLRRQGGRLPEHHGRIDVHALFEGLRDSWSAAPKYSASDFTELTQRLNGIMERLRTEDDLAFLIPQFYVQWSQLQEYYPEITPLPLPKDESVLRHAFFFCHSLIQMMEDVYTRLDLETNFEHPDCQGWMNLFRHWSSSDIFRLAFAVLSCTFGGRFQSFCYKRLDLCSGTVKLGEKPQFAEKRFNDYELFLLGKMAAECPGCVVRPLELDVKPMTNGSGKNLATFTIGFVLVGSDGTTLRWLRIQNHLRRVGHGRQALKCLRREGVASFDPLPCREPWCEVDSQQMIRWVQGFLPEKVGGSGTVQAQLSALKSQLNTVDDASPETSNVSKD